MTIYIDHGGESDEGAFPMAGLDGWVVPLEGQGRGEAASGRGTGRGHGQGGASGGQELTEALTELREASEEGDAAILTPAGTRAAWNEIRRLQRASGEGLRS